MSKTPKLRFKEFSGDWEENELGNIIEISKGKYNPLKSEEIYKCIELENLSQETGQLLGYFNSKEQQSIKNKFNKGQVLFGKLRPYLKKYWLADFDGVCSSEIWVLNGISVSNNFIYRMIQTDKFNFISNISSGSKMPRADWNYMSEFPFFIPSIEEQEKIASFFSLIDDKISLQSEKVETLKYYKKGMMQKIFSRKLRFKDNEGRDYPEWEEKKLSELVIFTNGKAHENCIDEYGKYIVVNSKFISSNGNIKKLSNENLCPLNKDDIALVMSDVPNGKALAKCYLIDEDKKYTLNQRICGLRSKDSNVRFLYYFINRNKYYLKFDNGVGQTNLRKDEVLECPILLPCKNEQEKIGNLLWDLDNKLEKEQEKLKSLNEYKKGLLQQMFV